MALLVRSILTAYSLHIRPFRFSSTFHAPLRPLNVLPVLVPRISHTSGFLSVMYLFVHHRRPVLLWLRSRSNISATCLKGKCTHVLLWVYRLHSLALHWAYAK